MKTWVRRRGVIDGVVLLCVLLLDQTAKFCAVRFLIPGISVPVGSLFGTHLSWTLAYNQGAAWGVFEGYPSTLLFFRFIFVVILIAAYLRGTWSSFSRIALVAVLAGAVGNIVDTATFGYVVDMIHVQLWGWDYPIFNVADSAICLGALVLFVTAMRPSQAKQGR